MQTKPEKVSLRQVTFQITPKNNRMLRRSLLVALLFLGGFSASLYAQEEVHNTTAVQSVLSRGYVRPSLTVAYVTDGSSAATQFVTELQKLSTEQFYYNDVNLPTGTLTLNDVEEKKRTKKLLTQRLKAYAERMFEKRHVGQAIMKSWFPKFDNSKGEYSQEVLAARGAYGATDADVLTAEASKIGKESKLMELGERMIARSYVQVVYVQSSIDKKGNTSWTTTSVLYHLDYSPEVLTTFYEKGFNKPNGIDEVEFPLVYAATTKSCSAHGMKEGDVAVLYDKLLTRMSQAVPDFCVQSPISEMNPTRAKIGLKEGLQVDDRYYVMEQVQKKDGTVKDVRRAILRVDKTIADNRKEADGHSDNYTSFYQVGGGNYDHGMTLVSKKDLGLSVIPILSNNFVGVDVEQRISNIVQHPGVFTYVRLGLPLGEQGSDGKYGPATLDVNGDDALIISMGLGVRKEFNFAKFLNFSVNLGVNGYGISTSEKSEEYGDFLNAYSAHGGARFGFQAAPNLGFFVGAEYMYTFGDHAELIKEEWKISPFSAAVGVRIGF